MNTQKAKTYAQEMVRIYLGDDWTFMYDLRIDRFGSTQFERKIISLSNPFVLMNRPAYVREALLHEIAHAMTGAESRDHGEGWYFTNLKIGGSGEPHINPKVTRPARATI